MNINLRLSIASALFVAGTTTALALPFSSLDPRSMAMGGAGVASTSAATAASYNPAMLAAGETGDREEDFAIEFPIIGMRISDPDNFMDSLDAFQQTTYIDDLSYDLNNIDTNIAEIDGDIQRLNSDIDGLASLDGKPVNLELGGGMLISIPGKKFAMAISGMGNVYTSVAFDYSDAAALSALAADTVLANACAASDPDACNDLLNGTNTYNGTTPTYLSFDGVELVNAFDASTDLTSSVVATGAIIQEIGLSMAREYNIAGSAVAIGITPKSTSVATFYYSSGVQSADTDDASDNTTEYSDFNMDIGAAKDFANGWRAGAVIKNIMAKSYDYIDSANVTQGSIEIKPMVRVGVSHQSKWHTIVLDLDLTENNPLSTNETDGTQYAALGAEFNAFNFLQLRVGYRADLVNSERSVTSAGVGLSPFGLHVDLAVAGNETDVGAALQLGFRF